jgi:hypothetical protein
MKRSTRPLQALFAKQQRKVKANQRMAMLLKSYAEDDHKRIARLLNEWLKE